MWAEKEVVVQSVLPSNSQTWLEINIPISSRLLKDK